ncbi:MAG: hypothetical protein BA861_04860 [Desulfobacterales bacterium S3730MH5]|nr:MAG: hypothetical protein BA861_04860 [Desulfobacterales bacterium S3730MH5]
MNANSNKSFVVCHAIPGRLRVKVRALRFSEDRAFALAHWLTQQSEIDQAVARPATGCLVLLYDPDKASPRCLVALLLDGLERGQSVLVPSVEQTAQACGMECPVCRPIRINRPQRSLVGRVIEVAVLTGFVAYTLIRRVVFKSPVAEGVFSLVAVVASVAAVRLFRHALEDMRQGKSLSLFPFLASTFILAIVVGEALTALEVIWILRVGMLLEDYVAEQSRRAISEILQVAAKDTYVFVDGVEIQTPVDQVRIGDTVAIHTGEKIPVDGVVLDGEALVDEAHITGRAEPEVRRANDWVFAGTIVQQGVIFIRAEKIGDETYLCRILHLVEDSLANRAPAEKHADVLAARLFRLGVVATLGTLLLTADPTRAFTVMLVMACPCATVLAASTAVTAALANAARNHVLIKGGLYLEMVGKADCFCFDKTGTLTTDAPEVVEVVPRTSKQAPETILSLAATAELHNEHPLARAVVEAAQNHGIMPEPHTTCEFILGRGVRCAMNGDTILVGNAEFMEKEGVNVNYFKGRAGKSARTGQTILYVTKNNKLQGMIAVANTLRPDARAVVDWLRQDGISAMSLVTGDTEPVAKAMAEEFGFHEYRAGLLPEEKAAYVEELQTNGLRGVMIGDGVNDALALSRAGVGIAMGAGGAEVAIEAADIALVDSDLERLVRLRQLSHQTLKTIEQNYYLAVSTNVFGTILGAAGWLTPIMAGLLHIVHTLGILVNSSCLVRWEAPGLEEKKLR